LELRPHHLFCLLGFRGLGYSEAFVANFERVLRVLEGDPPVRLVEGYDAICRACPRKGETCREAKWKEKDEAFLQVLGAGYREVLGGKSLLERARREKERGAIRSLCRGCRWIELCV
jgi:hypothetical protein